MRRKNRFVVFLLLVLVPMAAGVSFGDDARQLGVRPARPSPASGGSSRLALVIGNGAYKDSPLRNPVNDARAMADRLRRCGFEAVIVTDCGLQALEDAVGRFGQEIQGKAVALFFYAGHGIQVEGENYLVPVDAALNAENEVRYRCMAVGMVLAKMEAAGSRVNIVVLDACRNKPFGRSFSRSESRGLASMEAAQGTLIAFSTAPGKTAADGEGDHSIFAESLLRHLATPGLPLSDLFMRVRRDVMRRTDNTQIPWESTCLTERFCFVETQSGAAAPQSAVAPVVAPSPRPATEEEPSASATSLAAALSDEADDWKPVEGIERAWYRLADANLSVRTRTLPGGDFKQALSRARNDQIRALNALVRLGVARGTAAPIEECVKTEMERTPDRFEEQADGSYVVEYTYRIGKDF